MKKIYLALTVALLMSITSCTACPQYNVWNEEMEGKAELAKAEGTRQVSVLEAKAKRDAAIMLAEAEVERAKGVAKANEIIGASLKGNEDYLHYLWITGLESGAGRETVYIPTEAGLPILESNRLSGRVSK